MEKALRQRIYIALRFSALKTERTFYRIERGFRLGGLDQSLGLLCMKQKRRSTLYREGLDQGLDWGLGLLYMKQKRRST